jgi:hypothetical protein
MLVKSAHAPRGISKAVYKDGSFIDGIFVCYTDGRGYITSYRKTKGGPWTNRPYNLWWQLTSLNLIEWNEE